MQVSGASQPTSDSIVTSATQLLKASSLVSHSTVPTVSIEANQSSFISVLPVDASKSGQPAQSGAASIRPGPRMPIAVAPNRSPSSVVPLNRPTICRHSIIAPVPLYSSCSLPPNRKRARKQQLLIPQGSEASTGTESAVVNIVEMVSSQTDSGATKSSIQKINSGISTTATSTPNIEAALVCFVFILDYCLF